MGKFRTNEVYKEHDKQVCAAVLIYLERTDNLTVTGVRYPDYDNSEIEKPDLLAECSTGRLIIEHTRVQSYPKQILDGIEFVKLLVPLEEDEDLIGALPVGDFTLLAGIGVVHGAKKGDQIRALVANWIKQEARLLSPNGPPGNRVTGQPEGVPFEVALLRRKGKGSKLRVSRSADLDAIDEPLVECLNTALGKKLPKLVVTAKNADAKSIFVMESCDELKDASRLVSALSSIPRCAYEPPDLTFIVQTNRGDEWSVYPVKRTQSGLVAGEPEEVVKTKAEEYLRLRETENPS